MKSLQGKRILVTRPRAQAADLCDKLIGLGAQPIVFPTIEIAPLEDTSKLDQVISELAKYQWIIFTSANGVKAFWDRGGASLKLVPTQHLAAIGPATAQALTQRHVKANLIPEEYIAEAIVESIGDVSGQCILLPRADIAREALAIELRRRGAIVDEVAAYRTLPAEPDPEGLAELKCGVDVITFTSSSTVRNFVALVGKDTGKAIIACIGPITLQTAFECGFSVDVMATEYTVDGLVQALVDYYARVIVQES